MDLVYPQTKSPNPYKVPQIGWNEVYQTKSHAIFKDFPNPAHFYFVNSYYPEPEKADVVIGKTTYGLEFCSAIAQDNLIATQFHLEKRWACRAKNAQQFSEVLGVSVNNLRLTQCPLLARF